MYSGLGMAWPLLATLKTLSRSMPVCSLSSAWTASPKNALALERAFFFPWASPGAPEAGLCRGSLALW